MKTKTKRKISQSIVAILLAILVMPTMVTEAKQTEKTTVSSKVIVIDPRGQQEISGKKEPIGPGSFKTVEATHNSEEGATTGYPEYEMNLEIAQKLQNTLVAQGYTVIVTRDSNDVNISNSERAMIANTADADLLIAISGNTKPGVSVICQTDDNPYNYGNYSDGRLLSDSILGSVIQTTGSLNDGVQESDQEVLINWCASPTAIVEVGSLNNTSEEDKLVTAEYQQKMAQGIANGIESYFSQK